MANQRFQPAARWPTVGVAGLVGIALLLTNCHSDTVVEPSERTWPGRPAMEISSTGAEVFVGAGQIARCDGTDDEATANLLDNIPGTVYTLGDNVRASGSAADFTNCYGPSWGRHKVRTRPAAGDLDYQTPGATGYFDYFGAAAGNPSEGYYSYDLGDWHIVALNSNISMLVGSAQVQWLKADLAANTKECTLAYWHHPRFSSRVTSARSEVKPLWDALYAAKADVILNAHFRQYERFAPQNPAGAADSVNGIRQFVVGTGGHGSESFGTPRENSEVRNTGTSGVLKLTLSPGGYAWEFVPRAGQTFTDTGSGACHKALRAASVEVTPASATLQSGETLQLTATTKDVQGSSINRPVSWSSSDPAVATVSSTGLVTGVGDGSTTVTATSDGQSGSSAITVAPAAPNQPPLAEAGGPYTGTEGEAVSFDGSSSADPDGNTPLSYAWDFGDGSTGTGASPTHVYTQDGTYTVTLTVTDAKALGSAPATTSAVIANAAPAAQVIVGAGNITRCSNDRDEATAKLIDNIPGTVVALGDNAFPNGTAADYANCYDPTWGRHKARTYATLGNHEYDTGNANAAFDYFGDRVGPRGKGYYSFDLGEWHIIVLNDNKTYVPFGAGSEQEQWLKADLTANTKRCTLAMWHVPRFFSSSTAGWTSSAPHKILWDHLYAAGADIVLNAQQHDYERFAPQTPTGVRDDTRGIREFNVGTGGESQIAMPTYIAPNSERLFTAFGVLKLTLAADSYTWEFIPIPGYTSTDSGSGTCH